MGSHHVFSAADGEAAYLMALRYPPDVIVTDLRIPRIDGIDFITRIRESKPIAETPIVVMTAHGEDRNAALAAGADRFIKKPFDYRELAVAISEAGMPPASSSSNVGS
jgi:DNA-binding response OmpR family regulator